MIIIRSILCVRGIYRDLIEKHAWQALQAINQSDRKARKTKTWQDQVE